MRNTLKDAQAIFTFETSKIENHEKIQYFYLH